MMVNDPMESVRASLMRMQDPDYIVMLWREAVRLGMIPGKHE